MRVNAASDPAEACRDAKMLMLSEMSTKMPRMPRKSSEVPLPDLLIRSGITVPSVAAGPIVPMACATFSMGER